MNKNVMFLWFSLISVLLSVGIAKADDMRWHKPIPCLGCHAETINAPTGAEECGGCHDYGLNVSLLQEKHNPKICTACHMGNTLVNASLNDLFHNGHNAVNCDKCHVGDNSTVIKIEGIGEKGFPCVSCHGNQVHGIHINNLEKACPVCHGSWAKGKVYTGSTQSLPNTSKQSAELERFTIFSFIKNLFNTILGVR